MPSSVGSIDYEKKYQDIIKLIDYEEYDEEKKSLEELDNDNSANASRTLGRIYYKKGLDKEAASKFAPTMSMRESLINEASSQYMISLNKYDEAIKKIENEKPAPTLSIVEIAWIYHDKAFIFQKEKYYLASEEKYKKSIEVLERIKDETLQKLQNENGYPIAWFLNDLGSLYLEWGKYDEAIEQYTKAIKKCEENGYAHLFRGTAFFQKGNLTKAMEDYRVAQDEFAEMIKTKQMYDELNETIDKFIKESDIKTKKELLANIRKKFDKLKNFCVIKNEMEKFGNDLKNFEEKYKYADKDMLKYLIKYESFNAKTIFSDSLEHLKLGKACILTNMGRIELDIGEYVVAGKRFNEAKEIYDGLKVYLDALPKTSIEKAREFENISSLYNNLGILSYKQDKLDDSIKNFNEAIEYSESARAYNNLGNAYYKKNDKISAIENYIAALEINPEQKEARKNLNDLKDAKEEKTQSWWDWWFNGQSWSKGIAGTFLIVLFLATIVSAFIPYENALVDLQTTDSSERTETATIPLASHSPRVVSDLSEPVIVMVTKDTNVTENESSLTHTEETTQTYPTRTKTTKVVQNGNELSAETKLLFAALILFALIHPQIKGFSAGAVKFDLEPMVASKGATLLQCAG